MRDRPLHPDLQRKWGHLPYLRYRGNNEWSSACPVCGESGHIGNDDPDRFRLFGPEPGSNARAWCRNCRHFEWADEDLEDHSTPSPEAIAAAKAERERLAALERKRMRSKIEAIRESAYWKGWHDAMTEQQRDIWNGRGICDYLIDYYSLGYRTDYTCIYDGDEWHTPALTIPHYEVGWDLANIQYRLQNVPPSGGKYRQTSGLPAAMFRTEPEDDLAGAVLIVEGAIKSIVLYQHLGRHFLGHEFHIIGIPSKMPSGRMLDSMGDAEPIYLALDPDAYGANGEAARVGRKLGDRVRFVHFPEKPDDLIVEYGLTGDDLKKYLRRATRTV